MNGDYLWDRSGEPDPEIQQLEQVLGTLQHQPRPLGLPAQAETYSTRNLFSRFTLRLAIAATLAMMLLGLGIWLGLARRQTGEVAKTESGIATNSNSNPSPTRPSVIGTVAHEPKVSEKSGSNRVNRALLSRTSSRARRPTVITPELAVNERKEAEAAKEQLILALRVASSKLSFAQRKTQGTNLGNMIHNQHRIG